MGSISFSRATIIICLLLLTAVGITAKKDTSVQIRELSLEEALLPALTSWSCGDRISLSASTVEALELDDYLFSSFSKNNNTLSLYIGYYLNQAKIGAAHSPLVCFSGQGWLLSDRKDKTITIGNDRLHLASMVISKGEEKKLVLYWFQAYDKTSPGTFMQKLNLLQAKLIHSREDNAFVRVMIPFGETATIAQAQKTGIDFIKDLYPVFKDYLINGRR
ncbi:MAG: EpsI family protein [Desulfobulbaceae bacterium]|nr:EpsI family protein [Desulfobulbaceae bacterium]